MTSPEADASAGDRADGGADLPAGFRALFTEKFGTMVALARLLGSDDPEDTAQESFLRLHTRWASLRDPAAALGYLRTTVVNLSRNRIRHLTVARRHTDGPDGSGNTEPSAEVAAMDREQVGAVLAALDGLPARQREAIVLRYWLDLPYADIAAVLRCRSATARSHVRRGLADLADVLTERAEGP